MSTKQAGTHVHREALSCRCYLLADEPNEKCPQHGWPQPTCAECGRFMPYPANAQSQIQVKESE